jgi:GTP cyclohydrolase III
VPTVSSPNVAAAVAASATAGQTSGAAQDAARQAARSAAATPEEQQATISVDVIGVGGTERDAGR